MTAVLHILCILRFR